MVVLDDTPEFKAALFFAARVASRTGGQLVILNVIAKTGMSGWMPFDLAHSQSGNRQKVEGLEELRSWLVKMGITGLRVRMITKTGIAADEIMKVIDEDEDIAVLVLGASTRRRGPGPVVSSLTTGSRAGDFPIPIYLVPGNLSIEEISALA